ncbi:MAG: hypothetical protein Q7V05_13085 [Methanoregula sp.]|nr:hypothetical protein [Methanoregula sp.]
MRSYLGQCPFSRSIPICNNSPATLNTIVSSFRPVQTRDRSHAILHLPV